jgi:uncharacterized protein YbjT (DUF2867 family)
MKKLITVLGATGNVGSKVAAELLKKGENVRVVGRSAEKLGQLKSQGAEVLVGDITDVKFLSAALQGANAAFVMIPPDYSAPSFIDHYENVSQSIAAAIKASGVKQIVNLSSFGAELKSGTGPIKGLYLHEQRLNKLENVNIIHLRPTYFMENLLMNIPFIKGQGIMGGAIKGDVSFPVIATQDIADRAVEYLISPTFVGKKAVELLGSGDVTYEQAANLVSEVAGRKIPYVTFDGPSTKGALVGLGLSPDTADQFVEMSEAFNSGLISGKGKRTLENTTKTKLVDFVQVFKGLI